MVNKHWLAVVMMALALPACGDEEAVTIDEIAPVTPPVACDYTQAFGNSTHSGIACLEARGLRITRRIVQDDGAAAKNAFSGFLQAHESPPLTFGDFVVVPSTTGFVDGFHRGGESWFVQTWKWVPNVTAPGAVLTPLWTAKTDWQAIDSVIGSFGSYTNGYEQLFSPAIANNSLYVPGRNGTLLRLNLKTGVLLSTIDPLAGTAFDRDEKTLTVDAVSADTLGNLYYAVVAFPLINNRGTAPRGSWLVKVRPDDSFSIVDWEPLAVAAGAPSRVDLCEYPFGTLGTPPATGPGSIPPHFACGPQRPAMNAPIAIDDAGRLVALSYANNAQAAAFLLYIDSGTLTAVGSSDTRGHLANGCGVRLSAGYVGDSGTSCATVTLNGTTNLGVDPDFNGAPRFRGGDIMDNAPSVARNGDASIGGYQGGFTFGGDFDARGAGMTFHFDGSFAAKNEAFFWEVTAASVQHADGSISYLADHDLYSDLDLAVAQYDQAWNVQTLGRIPLDLTPVAIDWLDAHILFDTTGRHYAVNGSGVLVAFDASGQAVDSVPLTNPDGTVLSMETLSNYGARDRRGRVYISYAGDMFVAEPTGVDHPPGKPGTPAPSVLSGVARKFAALATQSPPPPPPPPAVELSLDAPAPFSLIPPGPRPRTVCGLPTQCQPWSCDVTTGDCTTNGNSYLVCVGACNTFNVQCPQVQPASCDQTCGVLIDADARHFCWASCMNNVRTSCDTQTAER